MPRTAFFRGLFLSMSMVAVASCSGEGAPTPKTPAPLPPVAEEGFAPVAAAPQPLSPSDTLTPILPAAPATPTAAQAAPIPVAPVGASVEERIARLEQTVNSLRSDYDRIMPAFASLNTTNERIQALLDEMEQETGRRPVAPAAPAPVAAAPVVKAETTTVTTTTAPVPAPTALAPAATVLTTETVKTETVREEPAATPAPAAQTGSVNAVRIGEHGTKTRLVLDMTGKTKPEFKYDLDNGEKLLLVDLPTMGWAGTQAGKGGAAAPLVEGWTVQPSAAGGSTLAIQLKKNARILSTQFLPPEGKEGARLVMDIAAGS